MLLETVAKCPICASASFKDHLTVKDYTVSKRDFALQECAGCSFLITNPRPDKNSLPLYYLSDNYISHTGGSNSMMDKLYVQARKFTLRWKKKLIETFSTKGSILDYGCGTGEFLATMDNAKWTTAGVEPSETARTKAVTLSKAHIVADLKQIRNTFDVITLWHVLEHVENLTEKIVELKSHLDKDGIIFIAVPNHNSAEGNKYGAYWAGYDVPRHLWHFSQATMKALLVKNGFRLIETKPMRLDSYYVSLLSEGYKYPQQFSLLKILRAVLSGFTSNISAQKSGEYSSLIYIARHA